MTETDAQTEQPKPTKTGWKKAGVHTATLPSGYHVSFHLPNLGQLIKSGDIPNDLIDAAIEFQSLSQSAEAEGERPKITPDMLEKSHDWVCWIIPKMLVEPKITAEDVPELPSEDTDMLAAFAARVTDMDAIGHHIGGLDTNAAFRKFRGLTTIDEIVEELRGDRETAAKAVA